MVSVLLSKLCITFHDNSHVIWLVHFFVSFPFFRLQHHRSLAWMFVVSSMCLKLCNSDFSCSDSFSPLFLLLVCLWMDFQNMNIIEWKITSFLDMHVPLFDFISIPLVQLCTPMSSKLLSKIVCIVWVQCTKICERFTVWCLLSMECKIGSKKKQNQQREMLMRVLCFYCCSIGCGIILSFWHSHVYSFYRCEREHVLSMHIPSTCCA